MNRDKNMCAKNTHQGSNFDDFLSEEGLLSEAEELAIKRMLAYQILKEMKKKRLSKIRMAQKMKTSRSALDRLLDPENTSVTLHTLGRAAYALNKKISVRLS